MDIQTLSKKYCNSLTKYSRYKTRVVKVGDIAIGGDNPIRVQSMTTTDTMDTIGTVEQSIRMIYMETGLNRCCLEPMGGRPFIRKDMSERPGATIHMET